MEANDKTALSTWIGGGTKTFSLLYQAARDGCSGQVFHQMCDHKGPTVTVCYNTAGYVFGGYNSVGWDGPVGRYQNDDRAFLFRLKQKGQHSPKMFRCIDPAEALYNRSNYGPTFGSGHDLILFTGTVKKTGHFFQSNKTSTPGYSYELQGDTADTFYGNNKQFTDIEVYQVTTADYSEAPVTKSPLTHTPWRHLPESNVEAMKSELETYIPPGLVSQLNVLLLGAIGAGKSSYFNTINSIFQGRITLTARSGSMQESLTTTYRIYNVKSSISGPLKIRLCDTRGYEVSSGLDEVEIMAVVDGHVPDRFRFNPSVPISEDDPGYKKNPTIDDRIHCVAFVVDSTTIDVYPKKILATFKSLQKRVNAKGIPQVILLTKVDKTCPLVNKDFSQLFSSAAVKEAVDKTSEMFGLPRSQVYPVKNYEEELVLSEEVNVAALSSFRQIMRFADDFINDSIEVDTHM